MMEFVIAMMVRAAYQAQNAPEIVTEEPDRRFWWRGVFGG